MNHKRIILVDDKPVGIYAVHTTQDGDLFINEISILKEYQNKGIGKKILEEQLKENHEKGIRTILQVFKGNPAKKLYEQLGFKVYGETETKISYPVFQPLTYSMNYINQNDAYNICKAMTESGNIYGFTTVSSDVHLMKSSEWGMISYLSYSKYRNKQTGYSY